MDKSSTRRSRGIRIIGGDWRGRRVPIPRGTAVRPTPDRVRETLFNWLAQVLPGARCLDLFAGTGILGLEALSRGAAEAWFVEKDPVLSAALEDQIGRLQANARSITGEAAKWLAGPAQGAFDVVFLDPPYEMNLVPLLDRLRPWLAAGSQLYVERPLEPGEDPLAVLSADLAGATVLKSSRAGRVAYGLLRLENDVERLPGIE